MDGPVIQEAALRALHAGHGARPGARRHRPGRGAGAGRGHDVLQPRLPGRPQAHGPVAGRRRRERGHHRPTCRSRRSARGRSRRMPPAIDTVLLVAPSRRPSGWQRICARARGFVYAVARMGVTGERGDARRRTWRRSSSGSGAAPTCRSASASACRRRIRRREVCEVADGVVVGSALVRRLLEGEGPEGAAAFVGSLPRGDRLNERARPSRCSTTAGDGALPRRRRVRGAPHVVLQAALGRRRRRGQAPRRTSRRAGVGAGAGLGGHDVLRVGGQGGVGHGLAREHPGVARCRSRGRRRRSRRRPG